MTTINDLNLKLPDLTLKRSLNKHVDYHLILNNIQTKLLEIPQINELRTHNVDLILLTCNLVENLAGKKSNIDKCSLVIEIFSRIFNYNENEQNILKNIINFLHQNKKIKKISYYKLVKTFTLALAKTFLKT